MGVLSPASCSWGVFLAAFSGSVIGFLMTLVLMVLIERYVPPRRGE
jgi:hypothetical protein